MKRCEVCGGTTDAPDTCTHCGAPALRELPGRGSGDIVLFIETGVIAELPPTGLEHRYLREYDPRQPMPRDGCRPPWLLPLIIVTADVNDALSFVDLAAARREWMRWDGKIRPDGRPSRPLTAFNISIEKRK